MGKYPDRNWAQLKNTSLSNAHKFDKIMQIKKYIEIPEEILVGLAEGRCVKGSLHRDTFRSLPRQTNPCPNGFL